LAATNDTSWIVRLAVDDLHRTFAFYLVASSVSTNEERCDWSPGRARCST